MTKKTLIPTDLRDFLSIISFLGFIAIFAKFTLNSLFLSELMDSLFLIISGAGLMVIGKVFTIKQWIKDGVQSNEFLQLFAILFGLSSMIIGFLLLFGIGIPVNFQGFVGMLALVPAAFIFIDYIAKND